ncbi:MAG TPA: DUF1992 domain-containing protein [Acidimicrobiales bacterium]|nr:DUF1992 domain-containing protein [Acidimicrobiales bacterium]
MTQRKPQGMGWQSWIDMQIEEGRRDGLFDDLPGTGKPLADLDRPRDEMWWVREKLRREEISYLPPGLQLRKDLEVLRADVLTMRDEAKVREAVLAFNVRIRHVNSHTLDGPSSNLMPLDVDRELARWREGRLVAVPDAERQEPQRDVAVSPPVRPSRRRWWSARRSRDRRPATP